MLICLEHCMLMFFVVPLVYDGTNFIFPIAYGCIMLVVFIVIYVSHAEVLLRWGVPQVKGEGWWREKGRCGAGYNMEPIDWWLIILVAEAGGLKTVCFVFSIPLWPCFILLGSFKGWRNYWKLSIMLLIIKVHLFFFSLHELKRLRL
jgi:hypothetical protein